MSKKLYHLTCLIVLGLITSIDLSAQGMRAIEFIPGGNGMILRDRTGGANISIPYEPYFILEAKMMEIELFSGDEKEGFYKYNLEDETLENTSSDEILKAGKVKSFKIMDGLEGKTHTFVNMKVVWPKNNYIGFFEQVDDNFTTIVKHFLEFKPADYDAKTGMGNPYDRVEQEIEMYFRVINEWFLVPKTKKQLITALSEFKAEADIKKFMRKNKIKIDDPQSIFKLVDYACYN